MEQRRRSNSEPQDNNPKNPSFVSGHKSIQWENKFIWLTPHFKKLFDINLKKSEFYHFYQGLQHELGLNQFPQNYQKAFTIYQYLMEYHYVRSLLLVLYHNASIL